MTGFSRFHLRPELERAVADAGFDTPRPVQDRTLPPALEGRDVLGLAPTGTGKTAAFALPILQRLLGGRGRDPRALVVAPTRELAAQVQAEFERLALHTPLRAVAVFGGVPIVRQERALRRGCDVLVACPGRLLDLLGRRAVRLDRIEVLVLDEADHMFDMGFLPDLRRILGALPRKRQNLLFSATMPREIRRLADAVLERPAVVELAHSRPADTIEHALCSVDEPRKLDVLLGLLRSATFRSGIVFLRTKHRAKRVAKRLADRGIDAVALQGNMTQGQRTRALDGFRSGRYRVLVATDIAARGLDIAGVSHVVNFDLPTTPEAYTHRIGRTGRSEHVGRAVTFVTPADRDGVHAIERALGAKIARIAPGRLASGPLGTDEDAPRARDTRRASSRSERPRRRERRARERPARAEPVRSRSRNGESPGRPAVSTRPARESGSAFGAGIGD